jgi:pimeloyl-ACP methyl ester carboxylesterase
MFARSRLLIVVTASAVIAVACGSDDGDGSADGSGTARASGGTSSSISAAPSGSPQQINGLVDIGGRSLYVECTGTKRPTVVLEAGGEMGHGAWVPVRRGLPADQRVCAYDRAGLGQSAPAPAPKPRTSQDVVADLRALLAKLQEKPPYLVVGFSIGGLYVHHFAALSPQDVMGVVLVEAVSADEGSTFAEHLTPAQIATDTAELAKNSEGIDVYASMTEVRSAGDLPDVPVVVITSRHNSPQWLADWGDPAVFTRLRAALQKKLATGPHRSQVFAEQSGHDVILDEPELVIGAITRLLH